MPPIADLSASDQQTLMTEASAWEGATCGPGDPGFVPADLCIWTYEKAFPLSRLSGLNKDWEQWVAEEMQYGSESRRSGMQDMLERGVQEAVVIQVADECDTILIWDGWHRIGTSLIRGDETIAAIVGRPDHEKVLQAGWDVESCLAPQAPETPGVGT